MVEMREWAVPILEQWGVDLVLCGHSHNYERSFLLDGHYGDSGSLLPAMLLDGGDGNLEGDGAYQKQGQGPAAHEGAVYVVAGNGSEVFDTVPGEHPAMITSQVRLGSVVLDVHGDRLQAAMIDDLGQVRDRFTIVKNTASLPQADFVGEPLVGAAPLEVAFADRSSTNTAAWAWDLDGDGLTDSTERHPVALYSDPGLFEVRLTASNQAGSDLRIDQVCASAIPVLVTGLVMADHQSLHWNPVAGATSYQVLWGELLPLLAAGGAFGESSPACLASGLEQTTTTDATPLPPGEARYYLVRAVSCAAETGSYDSGGPRQAGPREDSLPSQICP
jgi:hypothetical protein